MMSHDSEFPQLSRVLENRRGSEIENLSRVFENGASPRVDALTDWSTIPALFGSGTLLVGPADQEEGGTAAVIPPGVWARNPDGHETAMSREGWRLCRWAPHRLIDEHRPIEITLLASLNELSEFLSECELGLLWAERIVAGQIRLLRSLTRIDMSSSPSDPENAEAMNLVEALEAQAITAFGHELNAETAPASLADLATEWPEAEAERRRLHESPVSMDVDFELDLSKEDRRAVWTAAHKVSTYNLVTNADQFVIEAQIQASRLTEDLRRRLVRFRRYGNPVGALLISGVPIGDIPPTPRHADYGIGTGLLGAAAMSVLVALLGEQYGFRPELGGNIVQDIVPVRGFEDKQQSISSTTPLTIHVDKAFTENRSDYLCLLCLRPDHEGIAGTSLSSVRAILPLLDPETVKILREPLFKTTVDGSFLRGAGIDHPIWIRPICVLTGSHQHPRLRADFAETQGTDARSRGALDRLHEAAREVSHTVHLKAGDLLLIDNRTCLSGRTSFTARWDGNDRWLLRTFITSDLARSAPVRPGDGRIIDADYADGSRA